MAKKKRRRKKYRAGGFGRTVRISAKAGRRLTRKGHVPLPILEKRLKKLHNVVAKRGGRVPG